MTDHDTLTQPQEGDFVSLYCTLGRGMDPFVKAELLQVEQIKILKAIEGKIFFETPTSSANIRPTTAERVPWERSVRYWRLLKDEESEEKVLARLNVKVSGGKRKIFKPERLAGSLSKCLRLSVQSLEFVARGAQVSIDVHVSDAFVTVGMALTSGTLQFGLRSTTASAMAMCLTLSHDNLRFFERPLSTGEVILDPMCGKGSIPNAKCLLRTVKIGVDNDPAQLAVAKVSNNTLLLLADATKLPLRRDLVDHILCDLPFGLKYSKDGFRTLIPDVMSEIVRVLKPGRRAILLFARSERQFLKECAENCGLKLMRTFEIMLGVLEAEIFVFLKNNELT
ncbi:THUMP domain-containing protein 2-like isoform X2 [Cloeon dipterum]|uniref:THUMP domain-containing protein 2-like isoform X2 n=1 Tax=Cloeon dipterum TaxID=197152 RepID=UPI00322035F5